MVWYVHTEQYRTPLSLSAYVCILGNDIVHGTHTHVDDAKVGALPTENSQEIPDRTKD
jgi:hypothetical protein